MLLFPRPRIDSDLKKGGNKEVRMDQSECGQQSNKVKGGGIWEEAFVCFGGLQWVLSSDKELLLVSGLFQ